MKPVKNKFVSLQEKFAGVVATEGSVESLRGRILAV
jgi:hypothetical protein